MRYDIEGLINLGQTVVDLATSKGATVAEAVVGEGAHLSAKVRLGEPELVEEAGSKSLGLRVMRGQQVAVTFTSDLSPEGLTRAVEDALELARLSQPDPFAGPPDAALLSSARDHAELDLFDERVDAIDAAAALDMAKRAERAALQSDARLKNSEGATVARQSGASALVTSGGFRAGTRGTYVSLVVSPVAEDEGGKRRTGYHWSARRHFAELDEPEFVGLEAAKRTLAKLGSRKLETQELPVVFDPDTARSIVGMIGGCISGGAVWRRSTYLAEREATRVASDLVTIVDDPLMQRAPGSRPFDGEGLLSRRNVLVERGVLQGFLLDTYSARKLGKASTASASRGGSGGVGVSSTNLYLAPGTLSEAELLKGTSRALYVTDMMGYGFNPVTGDFSRGASGFLIENGERVFPVSEVTVSLNLDDLLQRIDAVSSELDLRTSTAAPMLRVSAMMVAGT
jgi:PmbA protein